MRKKLVAAIMSAAMAKGGTVDLGDQTIQLDRTLAVTNDVVITGGKLVGTSVVTGNLVTLGTKSWYGVNVDSAIMVDFQNAQLNVKGVNLTTVLTTGDNGNGTPALGKENVLTVMADGVVLGNVTINTDAANKSVLYIYMSDADLENVTLDNTNTAGGAGMIVNGGTATVRGNLTIFLGKNSWGGINVDGKNGASEVNFVDGSKVTVQDNSGKGLDAIYVENANVNEVTIKGAEAAGLVRDADGNYIVKTETKPGEDNKPAE